MGIRYRIHVLKGEIVSRATSPFTIEKNGVIFAPGPGTAYTATFKRPLPGEVMALINDDIKMRDLLLILTRPQFDIPEQLGPHALLPKSIAEFDYFETIDGKYAFCIHNAPSIFILSAAIDLFKSIEPARVNFMTQQIVKRFRDARDYEHAYPGDRTNEKDRQYFSLLESAVDVRNLQGEIDARLSDLSLTTTFDFRALIKKE